MSCSVMPMGSRYPPNRSCVLRGSDTGHSMSAFKGQLRQFFGVFIDRVIKENKNENPV